MIETFTIYFHAGAPAQSALYISAMNYRVPLIVLFAIMAAACSHAMSEPHEVRVGEQVALRVGESAHVTNSTVTIKLIGVNDSRCPSDVQCITAGDVRNIVLLSGNGADRTDTITVTRDPKATSYGGFRFEVSSVVPYPVSTNTQAIKIVTFLIHR